MALSAHKKLIAHLQSSNVDPATVLWIEIDVMEERLLTVVISEYYSLTWIKIYNEKRQHQICVLLLLLLLLRLLFLLLSFIFFSLYHYLTKQGVYESKA